MRITTKGRYGLRAVIRLAQDDSGRPLAIRKIASQEELSSEFLEQIFFKLKKSGIIESTRGAGGGFKLSRNPEEITVLAILEAVGEDINLSPCSGGGDFDCTREEGCPTAGIWKDGTNVIRDFFQNVTLADAVKNCALEEEK